MANVRDALTLPSQWGGRNSGSETKLLHVRWIDLDAKPKPKPKVHSTVTNRISLSNGICRFSQNKALATKGLEYLFLDPGQCDPADGSQWTTKKFPGSCISGIPRASEEGLVVLTSRIYRQIGLWDFKNPENPKFLKHWKVSGNPDLAVFHKGKIIVPCGHQGVLLQKCNRQ